MRTEPEPFTVLEDLDRSVRFHFDERISELVAGGTLDEVVTVSPRTGQVRVGHSRTSLSVSVEGGFRPGLVYRVTLLPIVGDLFGNQLRDAFELVFSTGGDPSPTTMAGQVWDRITGQGVARSLVHAVGPDSLVHVARAGDDGIYAFRYLPAGAFSVVAFEDLDRDGEAGGSDITGTTTVALASGDTLLLDVPVLAPDTTAAVAASASALDSVTVVIEFDDFLDPSQSADEISVRLTREDGDAPVVTRLYLEHEYRAYFEEVSDSLARADSLAALALPDSVTSDTTAAAAPDSAADPLAADTVQAPPIAPVPPGPARRGPPALPGGGRGSSNSVPGRVLPGRRVVGQLDGALVVATEYQVRVTSVVNLNGLGGGGGEVDLLLEAPQADSTGIGADTLLAAPDTAAAR